MKAWEMELTDVMRFTVSREEWICLIEALAGAAGWSPSHTSDKVWKALDVLKKAEVDIDASAMVKALTKIAEHTKHKRDNQETIIHTIASRALQPGEAKKGSH